MFPGMQAAFLTKQKPLHSSVDHSPDMSLTDHVQYDHLSTSLLLFLCIHYQIDCGLGMKQPVRH